MNFGSAHHINYTLPGSSHELPVPHAGIVDTSSCVGSGDVNQILMFAEQVLLLSHFFFSPQLLFASYFLP